jgi:hypothetical protein
MTLLEIISAITLLTTFLGATIMFYTNTNVRVKALEIKVERLEQNDDMRQKRLETIDINHQTKLDLIVQKIDQQRDLLSEVKVELQNKQNRKDI